MSWEDSASSLQLYLLGLLRLVRQGQAITALRRSKSQALLSYLAVTGGSQRRSTLAALLWPDYADKQAAMSLRTALSDLRKLVGEQLEVTGQSVSLRREVLWLDVAQFDALLKRTGNDEVDALQMQAAVSLYAGDFLAGFHVLGAPEFEHWVISERERLRQAMLTALQALAAWHAQQRDLAASLDQLTRLLAMEPASEAGHRQKMVVLARMGQRSAALFQYETCRRALSEELGVDPAPETTALRELILAGTLGAESPTAGQGDQGDVVAPLPRLDARVRSPRSASTLGPLVDWGDMPERSAFYGREQDLTRLDRWLTTDGAGLVVISGMGGVGKTTLAAEALARLASQSYDLVVWRTLVNTPPLASVLDAWLQALIDQGQDRLPATLDEKLALLFAELQDRRCLLILDNVESIMQTGVRKGTFRAGYEDYGQLIARMGRGRHRSCLLLTTRDLPAGLRRMEEDTPRTRILALEGLSPVAGLQLLRERGVIAPSASLETLVERYSGNPLALKLVADTVRDLFGADVNAFLRGGTPLFDDIRGVLDDQFSRLSALQREIITWLAVERQPIPVEVLLNDLVRPPEQGQFLEELQSLRRSSLVEETAGDRRDTPLRLRLQNVVMEYVADRLVRTLQSELESGALDWLHRHALVKAQCPEHVQESQRRLLLQPLAQWLVDRLGRAGAVQRLRDLLLTVREELAHTPGYAGANILHLLIELKGNLEGFDFSQLAIWQADLRKASLADVNFRNADLAGSTFADTFGAVASVAVSPDGRCLAAGGTDSMVTIWSIADFQPLHLLRGHNLAVTALAFSEDGRFLASSGFDEAIRLWDMQTGELMRVLQRAAMPIQAWSICIQGDLLAAAGSDRTIHVWNWQRGESLRNLRLPGQVDTVAFSPDGRLLAGAGEGSEINIWDTRTGEVLHKRFTATGRILALAFDADGETLASGGEDNRIQLWNVADMSLREVLAGHGNWILSLAFSPDGKQLASGSADHTARLWDIEGSKPLRVFAGHRGWVRSVAYTPDGHSLVTGSDDQTVRLWDTRNGELRHYLQGTMRWVDLIQFSPDGRMVISASIGGSVRLWAVDNGVLLHLLQDRQAATRALTFSHDSALAACGSDDHAVRVWDSRTGALVWVLQGHHGPVRDIAFSPDDRFLITGSHDETLRVWEVATRRLCQVIPNANARIQFAMAFNPTGDILAFCTTNHAVTLLEHETGTTLASISMADKSPNVVAFSPQGNRLAGGGRDGAVWIWNLDGTGAGDIQVAAPAKQRQLQPEAIWRLVFSPDGQLLACVGGGEQTSVLNTSTGQVRYSVPNYYGAYCLDFSQDGKFLLTAGADNAILIRDALTGEILKSLHGHASGLTSLSASPDGETIASSSADGTIRLWNMKTGNCRSILEPPRLYAGMNISGATGITSAQKATLITLGAIENT